jgi:uncharacterized protein
LLALRRALLADVVGVACRIDRCDPFVFLTPESGRAEIAALSGPRVTLVAQQGDDLGARMHHALTELIAGRGFPSAILVGSDVPLLTVDHLADAAEALRRSRLVLGPADDGGYYLIGMNDVHDLFTRIEWGSDTVLRETVSRARAGGIEPALIRPAYDIDTIDDLHRAEGDLVNLPPEIAPNLRAWFQSG